MIWKPHLPISKQRLIEKAINKAIGYLLDQQATEGFWLPLWFGNQHVEDDLNPVYGTTKVLEGLLALESKHIQPCHDPLEKALQWLLNQQNQDGGWGGSQGAPSSVEETTLSMCAVAKSLRCVSGLKLDLQKASQAALHRSSQWLFEKIESDAYKEVSPIGFYFAKLWYWESMYPMVYTGAALNEMDQWVEHFESSKPSEPA